MLSKILTFDQYLVNCDWGNYGAWSACTKTCGEGKQYRFRVIKTYESNGGTACDTSHNTEEQDCDNDSCPTKGDILTLFNNFLFQMFKYLGYPTRYVVCNAIEISHIFHLSIFMFSGL